ncbi:MAG: DUF3817 domain-containing protein [Angustibacter sp.]
MTDASTPPDDVPAAAGLAAATATEASGSRGAADVPSVRAALGRYRVAAFVVGVGLLVLCLEVVLHYGFDNDVLAWWSPVHGVLYMGYLVVTADLGLKARWSLSRMVLVMLAGVVPLFSFVMERRVVLQLTGAARLSVPSR